MLLAPTSDETLRGGANAKEHAMYRTHFNTAIAVIGIDIGKNSFHIVGHDKHGAIVLVRNGRVARWRPALPTCRRA